LYTETLDNCTLDTVSALDQVDGNVLSLLRGKEHDVMERIRQVSFQLERLEKQHDITSAMIETLLLDLRALPNIVRLERNLDTLGDLMGRVNSADMELNR
jgi:hypothetical protein